MFKLKWIIFFLFLFIFYHCQKDKYTEFPAIRLYQNENKKFLFTNKANGFFLSNSHLENTNKDEGWAVNNVFFVKDARVYLDSQIVLRDSLIETYYYPFSLIRKYSNGLIETFTILDSINVLLWEFEHTEDSKDLEFELVLHQDIPNKDLILSAKQQQVFMSPSELVGNDNIKFPLWLGACLFSESNNRVAVVCVLEKDRISTEKCLKKLLKDYSHFKEKRIIRIKNLLEKNQLYTNIPDVTDAVSWAQISLDALLIEFGQLGIRSGIPKPYEIQGRETFISLTSALLVSGKFKEAKSILGSFGQLQFMEEDHVQFGRIPNHIYEDSISYKSTEVTWWYIRAIYEYLLFTNDTEFVSYIFPVVKNAINGALRYRVDTNFFLLHGPGETWMNGGKLVERENRAVEVQAHWYAALQIAAELALISGNVNLSKHWTVIASTLQENFQNQFWNSYNYKIYDFLYPDGSRDKKVRPNQIFTVTTTNVPKLKKLIPLEAECHVTNTVVRNLTYRHGVTSLWHKDKNYKPYYNLSSTNIQNLSPYNGMVWNWLSRSIIESLQSFNYSDLAFELFYNQGKHILDWDFIGNYGAIQSVFPYESKMVPPILDTVSHPSSLAGFIQNFYHDFIGYQPIAPDSTIIFRPKLPGDLSYISTVLPFKENRIKFEYGYNEDERTFKITVSRIYGDDLFKVVIDMPGFDPIDHFFNKEKTSHTFQLYSDFRRSFKMYPNLDWYFAQPARE